MWHAEGQGRDFDGQQSGCHGNATFRSLDSPKVPGWGTSSFTDSPESPKKQRVIDIGSLGLNPVVPIVVQSLAKSNYIFL